MHRFKASLVVACLAIAPLLLSQRTFAETNPWLGTWKLNVEKSKYDPGTAPKSGMRTFTTSGADGITMKDELDLADGTKQSYGYTAQYDGKPYEFAGPDGDHISLQKAAVNAVESTVWKGGKPVRLTHSIVSHDGTVLTLTTSSATGKPINTQVYDKQ